MVLICRFDVSTAIFHLQAWQTGRSRLAWTRMSGSFNVISDRFPRVPQPLATLHAPCTVLYFVAMPMGC